MTTRSSVGGPDRAQLLSKKGQVTSGSFETSCRVPKSTSFSTFIRVYRQMICATPVSDTFEILGDSLHTRVDIFRRARQIKVNLSVVYVGFDVSVVNLVTIGRSVIQSALLNKVCYCNTPFLSSKQHTQSCVLIHTFSCAPRTHLGVFPKHILSCVSCLS